MCIYYILNLWTLSTETKESGLAEEVGKYNRKEFFWDLWHLPLALTCQLLLSPRENREYETQAMIVPLLPCVFSFCSIPSWIMKVDQPLGFPFSLPLSFPFATSQAFLAQGCCVWVLICQAVINSKKNPFLLNYFQNVMQTCLNYVAANSALRSAFHFMLIQVEERNEKGKTPNVEMPFHSQGEFCFKVYSFWCKGPELPFRV